MQRHDQGRAHVLLFEGLTDTTGRPLTTAFGAPPSGKVSELTDHFERAISRLDAYDAAVLAAKKATHLSELGREQHVSKPRAAAQQAVETATVYARHAIKTTAAARAALYAPPQLDSADAVAATRDASIQQRYAQMDDKARKALHAQMGAGQNDVALHALLRDPLLAGPQSDIVQSVWRPRVERERAAELAKIEAAEDEARRVLTGIEGAQRNVLDKAYAALARPPRTTEDITYLDALGQ